MRYKQNCYLSFQHLHDDMNNNLSFSYNGITIELFDDPGKYTAEDNRSAYALHYFASGQQEPTGALHGIRLYKNDLEINSCLLIGSAGTMIHSTSALLDGDCLLVCCGNSVFSLSLPDLELKWQAPVDFVVCFQIFALENDYLVHGETEVSRLSKNGEIIWSFSGCDIFVSIDGETTCAIHENCIELVDWEKNRYTLDFNGKVIYSSVH